MIKSKLANTVRLPFYIVKGSIAQRQGKAEQFTNKVVNNISGPLKQNDVSLAKLAKLIKEVLPSNLRVFIIKCENQNPEPQISRVFTKDNRIIEQQIELILDENNKIGSSQIPAIAHEIRHLADSIYHPKILAREQIVVNKALDTDKYTKFYEEEIYVKEYYEGKKDKAYIIKYIRHRIEKVLRGLTSQDKIDFLQCIRYDMIGEYNAFKTTKKYAKKLNKDNVPLVENLVNDQTKDFILEEKINLLKNMIYELIKEERGKHRAKLKKLHKTERTTN